jgi:hypothetical protein
LASLALGPMTLSIAIPRITTLNINGLFATFSLNDTQPNNTLPLC